MPAKPSITIFKNFLPAGRSYKFECTVCDSEDPDLECKVSSMVLTLLTESQKELMIKFETVPEAYQGQIDRWQA
jgi:hypothetical protein